MSFDGAADARPDRAWAAACGLGTTVLAAVGLALSLSRPRFANLVTGHELGDVGLAVACGWVAALILSRRRRHPVGIVFAAIGVAEGLSMLSSGLLDILDPGQPGYRWGVWLSEWTWVPGLLLIVTVLPLVFPEGSQARWQRRLLRCDVALIAAVCLGQALAPRLQSGPHAQIDNPVGVPGAGVAGNLALLAALASAVVSLVTLVRRLLGADERTRRQLLPMLSAGVVVIGAFSFAGFFATAGVVVQDVCFLPIPAAALFSVLRLRLCEIELAIGRTATWIALSGLLIGGYVLIVEITSDYLRVHGRTGSVIATAAVALAFGPLRLQLQRWVAQWLYGDRGDPYGALAHTTQVLSGGADPIGALRQAAVDLAYRLRSPGARILRDDVLLVGPADGRAAIAVTLRRGDTEVGRLEILPRGWRDILAPTSGSSSTCARPSRTRWP